MARLFTIGYEGADAERFLTTLQAAGVAVVADIRAVALSRKRGFSKNVLRQNLEHSGIDYRHFVNLGTPKAGRQAARAGDAATMHRIYCDEILTSGAAQASLDELAELAQARPVCLLCFERDPIACHRRIVAERLASHGIAVTDLFVV